MHHTFPTRILRQGVLLNSWLLKCEGNAERFLDLNKDVLYKIYILYRTRKIYILFKSPWFEIPYYYHYYFHSYIQQYWNFKFLRKCEYSMTCWAHLWMYFYFHFALLSNYYKKQLTIGNKIIAWKIVLLNPGLLSNTRNISLMSLDIIE